MFVMTGDFGGYDKFIVHNRDGGARGFRTEKACFEYVRSVFNEHRDSDDPIQPDEIKVTVGKNGSHYVADDQITSYTSYRVG